MNFHIEAENCKRTKEIFKDNPNVFIPKIYDEFTSDRTLVMSFEKGISVTKVNEMHEKGIDLKKLS